VAGLPLLDQGGDQFGRILQVGVDHHHRVAGGGIEPGGQRRLLAEVARQLQRAGPRIGFKQGGDDRPGVVGAAVVDVQHAAIERQLIHDRTQALVERAQHGGFVVGGDDDGELRHGRHQGKPPAC